MGMSGPIPWTAWTVMLPCLGALLFFFGPARRPALILAMAAAILLTVAGLTMQVWELGTQRHAAGNWQPPLGIVLHADGLAVLMLAMTGLTGAAASLYATAYFSRTEQRNGYFWPLWFFLWAGLNALFLSADIFNIYVTLELAGLAAVALVALSGGREAAAAAMRYLLVALLGSLFYLLGVALLYGAGSSLDLQTIGLGLAGTPVLRTAAALMTVGLLLKTALFPLHFWLPAAHANAPAPVSAVLSGLVVKASFYLLLRLWLGPFAPLLQPQPALVLGLLGSAAIFWGSGLALRQKRLKMLVAYSTVAQIGYLFLLFPLAAAALPALRTAAIEAGVCHALSHAFAKGAMFLAAGSVIRAVGHDRMDEIGGIWHHMPMSVFALGAAGVTLMGLPISGGFIAKWLFLTTALASGQWWWAPVILAGGLLAAAYIYPLWRYGLGRPAGNTAEFRAVPKSMELSALFLALLSLFMGMAAGPVLAMLAKS